MRLAVYAGTSALVAAGALLKAFHQRPNFYSATVYLSQSNACVLILTNLALVCASTFIYGLQRLFYGPLRQIEIDQLTEKAWYAVLDTLLAMPSLSHDVSGWMLAIFVLLLAGKVWGWIGEGRVDILEQQPPQNPRVFHARLSSSLVLSVVFDACMLRYCIRTVRDDPRPGMMVIFTFEFAILTIFSLFTFSRYILALLEANILRKQTEQKIEERKAEIRAERERIQQEQAQAEDVEGTTAATPVNLPSEDDVDENEIDVPGWEEKRRWLFGLELATDFIKLIIYSVFFAISLTFMGLPMHIMRDVYLTFSAFAKRIQDYRNYRRATQNMNDRYSDATAEELINDNTCIVCRETMEPWEQPEAGRPVRMNEGLRAKKLPCGHILHLRCLKAWLERQQACPTCRRPVISNQQPNSATPGQPRIEGPNAGAQPAGNGNAQAPGNNAGQAPAQAPQRANRLRMLNLGPIRIGLYNGPAHQVQEALAQRNALARQNQGAAEPTGVPTASLGTQSTQIQLMQVEERLIREARNLAIEQTQLLTVRALEAELARLRALHSRAQQLEQIAQPLGGLAPTQLQAPMAPMTMPMPLQNPFAGGINQFPQAFQALPGQTALVAGDAGLPQGMTLPEGWTVTPLYRVGGVPPQQQQSQPPQQPQQEYSIPGAQTSDDVSNVASALSSSVSTTTTTPAPPRSTPLPSVQRSAHEDPSAQLLEPVSSTSDVTAQTSSAANAGLIASGTISARNEPQTTSSNTTAVSEPIHYQSNIAESTPQVPTSAPSWNFNDLTSQQESSTTDSDVGESTASDTGVQDILIEEDTDEEQSEGTSTRDKGKGKAATVEDVQDEED